MAQILKTYEIVEMLNRVRKNHRIGITGALYNNSSSSFHRENYLKELDRIEEGLKLQLEGIAQMKRIINQIQTR